MRLEILYAKKNKGYANIACVYHYTYKDENQISCFETSVLEETYDRWKEKNTKDGRIVLTEKDVKVNRTWLSDPHINKYWLSAPTL